MRTLALSMVLGVAIAPGWGFAQAAEDEAPPAREENDAPAQSEQTEAPAADEQEDQVSKEETAGPRGPSDEEVEAALADPALTAEQATALGDTLYAADRYDGADKAWQRALALGAEPTLWVAVAEARERRGDLAGAVEALKQYLQASPEAPDRPAVEARITALDESLAAAAADSAGDSASVDDSAGGSASDSADDGAGGPSADLEPPPAEPDPKRIRTAVWATGAVGAAALVTGTVLGFLALKEEDEFRNDPTLGSADRGDRLSIAADFSFGIAAAAGISALVIYLTTRKKDKAKQAIIPEVGARRATIRAKVEF